jgi:hypothetical protein
MRHFIARLIQCKFDLPQAFHACSLAIGHQLERRLECQRRDRSQHFRRIALWLGHENVETTSVYYAQQNVM